MRNGARCVFGTRYSRTGRGFSLDLWIADEAHILDQAAHDALMPATSARKRSPQVWYAGLRSTRTRTSTGSCWPAFASGRSPATPRAFLRRVVGAPLDDGGAELRPEQGTPEMITPEHVEQANPAYGVRIRPEHVEAERAAMAWRGWLS